MNSNDQITVISKPEKYSPECLAMICNPKWKLFFLTLYQSLVNDLIVSLMTQFKLSNAKTNCLIGFKVSHFKSSSFYKYRKLKLPHTAWEASGQVASF